MDPSFSLVSVSAENECGFGTTVIPVSISAFPETYFTSDVNSACGPLEVQFYDLSSTDVNTWNWEFPGGTPSNSNEQNPVVSYTEVGSYGVRLKTTNSLGQSEHLIEDFINVYEFPVADFEFDSQQTDGVVLASFMSTSIGADTHFWDFGDGWTNDAPDPLHIYPENGIFTVTLTIENDCGIDSITKTINVMVLNNRELYLEGKFELFPNPNSGLFTLKGSGIEAKNLQLNVLNVYGQVLHSQKFRTENTQLNEILSLEHLSEGLYLIELISEDRRKLLKMIKQ